MDAHTQVLEIIVKEEPGLTPYDTTSVAWQSAAAAEDEQQPAMRKQHNNRKKPKTQKTAVVPLQFDKRKRLQLSEEQLQQLEQCKDTRLLKALQTYKDMQAKNAAQAARLRAVRANETAEQREARRAKARVAVSIKMTEQSEMERKQLTWRQRHLASLTAEQLEAHRAAQRSYQRNLRAKETPERRAKRLAQMRKYVKDKRRCDEKADEVD